MRREPIQQPDGAALLLGAWLESAVTATLLRKELALKTILATIERHILAQALSQSRSAAAAARLLGINRTTLAMKRLKYGLTETPSPQTGSAP